MNNKYVTIKLPKEMVEEIDSFRGYLGFRSRGEFVKEAVRQLILKYRSIKTKESQTDFPGLVVDVEPIKPSQ